MSDKAAGKIASAFVAFVAAGSLVITLNVLDAPAWGAVGFGFVLFNQIFQDLERHNDG